MSAEQWRPIPGWPGYMASSEGRVRSHVKDPKGRLMVLRQNPNNLYWTAGPTRGGKQKWIPVHVLVALAFHGPRPPGHEVRHLDGSRDNNRADNLAWGTHAENMQDMVRHGSHPGPKRAATRTHCKNGHPLNEANAHVITKKGGGKVRRCRVCDCMSRLRCAERDLAIALEAIA